MRIESHGVRRINVTGSHCDERWTPILGPDTPQAGEARAALNSILEGVETYPSADKGIGKGLRYEDEALLYSYLGLAEHDNRWLQRAESTINCAIEHAESLGHIPALFGGLAGLGWLIEHVSKRLSVMSGRDEKRIFAKAAMDADNDINADIDKAMLRALKREEFPSKPYDLISGLVGWGVYFLERLPRSSAVAGLEHIAGKLEALAEKCEVGRSWSTAPILLPEWQRKSHPGGYYNLGVAHGIPGILFLLDEMSALGIGVPLVNGLLVDGVNWFLAQRNTSNVKSWFSAWVPSAGGTSETRLTWCYGDLGILAILLRIGNRVGWKELQDFSLKLFEHCLQRSQAGVGILDAPLCHGFFGGAHIFNRFYQHTGDLRCREAALRWAQYGLGARDMEGGIGGFYQLVSSQPIVPLSKKANPAFLDGAIGIALALISMLFPMVPHWDRLLLLS